MGSEARTERIVIEKCAKYPTLDPDERTLLSGLMQDGELMGILGLQAGWTPDLKGIDPDLDLRATDPGDLS